MSLYNLLFGVNSHAPVLKGILGLDAIEMPTPPDCLMSEYDGKKYFDYGTRVYENDQKETWDAYHQFKDTCIQAGYYPTGRFRDIHLNDDGSRIILYTRNGGGNRPYYRYVFDLLRKHPNYDTDYDDDFDCTYAYIEFTIPDQYKELCQMLATGEKPETIHAKFSTLIESMKTESHG